MPESKTQSNLLFYCTLVLTHLYRDTLGLNTISGGKRKGGGGGRGKGEGGGGPLLFIWRGDEIKIMKWSSIPLLLFEEGNNNNEMAPHSIILI